MLRHFNAVFNFVPCNHRVQKEQIRPPPLLPSPPLVQCCFGLTAQVSISSVTVNNIAIGEGGNGLSICDCKDFCQGKCKKIGIFVMCLNRFCLRCRSSFALNLSLFRLVDFHDTHVNDHIWLFQNKYLDP